MRLGDFFDFVHGFEYSKSAIVDCGCPCLNFRAYKGEAVIKGGNS